MRTRIEQSDYPLNKGESWWVVNPNSSGGEFIIPQGASTACLISLLDFKAGTVYRVGTEREGWVFVINGDHVVEMPQYVFARHFDAEIFIRGRATKKELETLIPKEWKD
jgi:hypothetical protein